MSVLPPTFKFSATPTPPETTSAPVVVFVDPVVSPIVNVVPSKVS